MGAAASNNKPLTANTGVGNSNSSSNNSGHDGSNNNILGRSSSSNHHSPVERNFERRFSADRLMFKLESKLSKVNLSTSTKRTDKVGLTSIGPWDSCRRLKIYDSIDDGGDEEVATDRDQPMNPHTKAFLTFALTEALRLDDLSPSCTTLLDNLVSALEYVTVAKDEYIVRSEQASEKLFIIESGRVDLHTDAGNQKLEKGNYFGSSALYFDSPSSYTAVTLTICKLWSLSRKSFKYIQRHAAANTQLHRILRLSTPPEFRSLPVDVISEIAASLSRSLHKPGEDLLQVDVMCNHIMLIESGTAVAHIPTELENLHEEDILKLLGIHLTRMDPNDSTKLTTHIGREDDSIILGEGCVIGLGCLRARAGLEHPWKWVEGTNEEIDKATPRFLKTAGKHLHGGGISPVTITTSSNVTMSSISVRHLEQIFGSLPKLFSKSELRVTDDDAIETEATNEANAINEEERLVAMAQHDFELSSFHHFEVFKNIHMGWAVMASSLTATSGKGPGYYVLKVLHKQAIVNEKQVRHVLAEASILHHIGHPFICKLLGRLQTPDNAIFVMEWIPGGDLWYRLYGKTAGDSQHGLHTRDLDNLPAAIVPSSDLLASTIEPVIDIESIRFYIASLIIVFGHLRHHGIAYRNLKPENVMLTRSGYIKLIGFGIAKKIPYKAPDHRSAAMKNSYVTYTLCGTLDYMAPEMVFSSGHDHAVDKWALGILLFEMMTGTTPFASSTHSEMAMKILGTAKTGFKIDASQYGVFRNEKFGVVVKKLVEQLVIPDHTARASMRYNDIHGAFGSEFFTGVDFDWDALHNLSMSAPYKPDCQDDEILTSLIASEANEGYTDFNPRSSILTALPQTEPFTGDQKLFSHFSS